MSAKTTAIPTFIMSAAVSLTAATGAHAYASDANLPPPYVVGETSASPQILTPLIQLQVEYQQEATKRLEFLATLDEDHDGEGALAPNAESISAALSFLRQLDYYAPDPIVGLTRDGNAVIEFHDNNEIGQIIFYPDRTAEVYSARPSSPSVGFEGSIDDPHFATKFVLAFGFRFAA
jgi:hypothetical protein